MKFRLTYEGPLLGSSTNSPRADHKHEIRQALHPQLKRLWEVEPNLKAWVFPKTPGSTLPNVGITNTVWARDALAEAYGRFGYNFVPIATEMQSLMVGVDILFLRPEPPGGVMRSGDIDNRLKTLFDALRMPSAKGEIGKYQAPADDQTPFFVLLEDDKLLTHVSVETDVLLQPTPSANGQFLPHDCRLVMTVTLRPYAVHMQNLHFA